MTTEDDSENDFLFDYLSDKDELRWLRNMKRRGSLNTHGLQNLARAREIHKRQ